MKIVFRPKAVGVKNKFLPRTGALRLMQETARKIAKVSKEAKLEIDEETYVEKFKPHMMDVVYAWSTGKSFAEICQMTDIFEGSIIRTMRRLEVKFAFSFEIYLFSCMSPC